MNALKEIAKITYRLKRDFGMAISILQYTKGVVNVESGLQESTTTRIEVRRAIVGSVTSLRRYAAAISGGQFSFANPRVVDSRIVILDKVDVPTLNEEDHLLIGTKIYDIDKLVEAETNNSFLLLVKHATGVNVPTVEASS
jgi:hypothetical protein